MNVKITPRKPEGVLIDLEGPEVRSGGRAVLALSDAQFAAFVGFFSRHLERKQPKKENP